MNNTLAITVLGHDRPGIIADVTKALAYLGGNLEDSSMTLLRGHFAMTLIVNVHATADEAAASLHPLTRDGLTVSVLPVKDEARTSSSGNVYLLSVHGADRPGIVSSITSVVAQHGGNIVDLTTRLGTNLYLLTAEVELPSSANVDALVTELKATAQGIGVDVSFLPADIDTI